MNVEEVLTEIRLHLLAMLVTWLMDGWSICPPLWPSLTMTSLVLSKLSQQLLDGLKFHSCSLQHETLPLILWLFIALSSGQKLHLKFGFYAWLVKLRANISMCSLAVKRCSGNTWKKMYGAFRENIKPVRSIGEQGLTIVIRSTSLMCVL